MGQVVSKSADCSVTSMKEPMDGLVHAPGTLDSAARDLLQKVTGATAVAAPGSDVARHKQLEHALRHSEHRFAGFMEHLPGLAWIKDLDGRYVFVNAAAANVFGRPVHEICGRTDDQIFPAEIAAQFRHNDLQALRSDAGIRIVETLHHADGVHHSLVSKFAILDQHNQPSLIGGIAIDVTERVKAEQLLRNAKDDLERRVSERTAELRALARELTRTEHRERKRLAQVLHDDVQQLLAAVRIQADIALCCPGKTQPMEQVMKLADEAIAACRSLIIGLSPPVLRDTDFGGALHWLARHMKEHQNLHVDLKIHDSAPDLSEDARTLLFEVTRELLFNVVKHAGIDRATVTVQRINGSIVVQVADQGKGCDPQRLLRPGQESFGLISVRERLVDLGGQVEAAGSPGKGCQMKVMLPVTDALDPVVAPAGPAAVNADPPGHRRKGMRVLLADDHQILRQGLAELLASQPDTHVIAQASDGIEAVQLARKHRPDVVIMDITMPGLSGIEATRLIRSEMPEVRVVGLSMHEREDMAAAMRDAGADAYLNKGGPVEHLLAALRGKPVST